MKAVSDEAAFFFRFYLCQTLTQNIDGGNSLDNVRSAVPKLVRSMRMPEKRNDIIRYTGRMDERIFERAVRMGRRVITVPTANESRVTITVYKIT